MLRHWPGMGARGWSLSRTAFTSSARVHSPFPARRALALAVLARPPQTAVLSRPSPPYAARDNMSGHASQPCQCKTRTCTRSDSQRPHRYVSQHHRLTFPNPRSSSAASRASADIEHPTTVLLTLSTHSSVSQHPRRPRRTRIIPR